MELTKTQASFALSIPNLRDELPRARIADYAVCRQIMLAASKNYSSATRLLPPAKIPHVTALYAVMRVGDDRVDVDHHGFDSARAAIADWQNNYWRAFETGDSPHPVLRAYLHTAQVYNISPILLQSYFRAMFEDLTTIRFATFADLMRYMEGSAIPVGRAMTHILGVKTRHITDAYPAADALSAAMQLSNFWRDIGEDWERSRVYIPQEDLARFNYTENDLAAHHIDDHLIDLLEFEFQRTETYYEQARAGVRLLASGQLGVMSALEFYHAILPGIRRNHYDMFTKRAATSRRQKIELICRAWWQIRQAKSAFVAEGNY
jgi:phytoene synthase